MSTMSLDALYRSLADARFHPVGSSKVGNMGTALRLGSEACQPMADATMVSLPGMEGGLLALRIGRRRMARRVVEM